MFERLLLKESGYEVTFDARRRVGRAGRRRRAAIDLCPTSAFTPSTQSVDERLVFDGATLLAIAADDYRDERVRRAAKQIMRRALAPHLGDKPIAQSRAVSARERRAKVSRREQAAGSSRRRSRDRKPRRRRFWRGAVRAASGPRQRCVAGRGRQRADRAPAPRQLVCVAGGVVRDGRHARDARRAKRSCVVAAAACNT